VIAKAEHREEGSSSRFVVASLSPEVWEARRLQEDLQGARGEMENRIKEQRTRLTDRRSRARPRRNPLRLDFFSVA
jgi:hypothetical protein